MARAKKSPQPATGPADPAVTAGQQTAPPMDWPPTGNVGHPGPIGESGYSQAGYPPPGYPPQPGYPAYYGYPPQRQSGVLVPMLVGFVLLLVLLLGIAGSAYLVISTLRSDNGGDGSRPAPAPVANRFEADILRSVTGETAAEDAVYLRKLTQVLADIVENDGKQPKPEINTRGEFVAIISKFGQFGVSSVDSVSKYAGLSAVLQKALGFVLPPDAAGNTAGGDFTAADRQQAVLVLRELADGFAAVK